MLVFGRDPIGLGDAPSFHSARNAVGAEEWFQKVKDIRKDVQQRVNSIHDALSARYKSSHKEFEYQPGDRVWVRNLAHDASKLDPLWTGPCEVLARAGNTGRYHIAFPEGIQDVHMERLKLYLPKPDGIKIPLHYYRPHRDLPEDDSLVLEKIVGHRIRGGRHQWRVRWKGYDESFDSWEPANSFVGYLQMDWLSYNRDHHIHVPLVELRP